MHKTINSKYENWYKPSLKGRRVVGTYLDLQTNNSNDLTLFSEKSNGRNNIYFSDSRNLFLALLVAYVVSYLNSFLN